MKKILKSFCILCVSLIVLAMAVVPVSAQDNFTKSVVSKNAPEVVKGTYYLNTDDTNPTEVPLEVIHAIAYTDRASASASVKAALEKAYNEINSVDQIADIDENAGKKLDDIAASINANYDASVFVASDLFELSVDGANTTYKFGNGQFIRITFKAGFFASDVKPVIIHKDTASGEWKVLDYDKITLNADGTVSADFDGFCPVAILRVDAARQVSPDNLLVKFAYYGLILLLVIIILLTLILLVLIFKKPYKEVVNKVEEKKEEPAPAPVQTQAPQIVINNVLPNAPANEEKKEEPKPVEVTEDPIEEKEEPKKQVIIKGVAYDADLVRFRRSYLARLTLAPDETKKYYSDLKNEILAYTDVKSRIAKNYETFGEGRTKLVRFDVKGKTLAVYFALNAKDYADTKYKLQDESNRPDFEEIGAVMKITSDRAYNKALELVKVVMEKGNFVKGDVAAVDYVVPAKTEDELIDEGLIKVIFCGKGEGEEGETNKVDLGAFINKGEISASKDEE